jgi:hypothetical protein
MPGIEAKHDDEAQVRFIAQGVAVHRRLPTEVWLAYCVHTLHWTPREYAILLAQLQRWQHAGNNVVGVQSVFRKSTHVAKSR